MICNYIDIQRFRFLWFSQNLIKIPLTEIKCLRIVYADMIFAYLSTFIIPTDYLFSLIYSWNNNQIFVLFALFTHCLRDVYALFTQNSRINGCISMYFDGCLHLLFSFEGTFVEKSHFWDKTFRLFIGKASQKQPDYSLFTQDFPQCDFCGIGWRFFNLTYTFWMLVFVDVLTWLNVRVHSIRSDSVVLLPPKVETHRVSLMSAILSAAN